MKIEVAQLDNGRWAVLVDGIARWAGWDYNVARQIADALTPVGGRPVYEAETMNRALRRLR